MEEKLLTGYCRAVDGSRRVWAELEDGTVESDCAWPHCPYGKDCSIGKALEELREGREKM